MTEKISQIPVNRNALSTDIYEVESAGGVSAQVPGTSVAASSMGLDSIVSTDTTITFTRTGADLVVRKIILPLE